MSYKAQRNGGGESYSGIVPAKRSNEGRGGPKETVEGRPLTKENMEEPNSYRTQRRESEPSGLDRVRQTARQDQGVRFTALLHHVSMDLLRSSYYSLKRQAAAGVDGMTWQEYGEDLEARLADLHGRIHSGGYRAKPSRRVWIPKTDGRQRPLGIAALEDKIAQQERVRKFGLELHPDKTRLIEFGRYAAERRKKRGEGKPETFNFLGFTHICGRSRKGYFTVTRKTIGKRMAAKLKDIRQKLRKRMHESIEEN